ncbi:MAG: divergent PAP2 family protein [Clostridiaceae bacterium]|nr:divergent PAP2 family protein [Clostridiaceae bacterium]
MEWNNRILLAAVIAWASAQIIKVALSLLKDKKLSLERFVGSGGMPSSHTSFVIALVTSVGKYTGINNAAFAIAAAFALVTMYDATGVRRAAGEQAKILNYMMDNWKNAPDMFQKNLKELIGHTPREVIVGAFLGFGIGLLV